MANGTPDVTTATLSYPQLKCNSVPDSYGQHSTKRDCATASRSIEISEAPTERAPQYTYLVARRHTRSAASVATRYGTWQIGFRRALASSEREQITPDAEDSPGMRNARHTDRAGRSAVPRYVRVGLPAQVRRNPDSGNTSLVRRSGGAQSRAEKRTHRPWKRGYARKPRDCMQCHSSPCAIEAARQPPATAASSLARARSRPDFTSPKWRPRARCRSPCMRMASET